MLTITLEVDAPSVMAIGIKEAAAMYFEKFGDTRVVSVKEAFPEQIAMEDKK